MERQMKEGNQRILEAEEDKCQLKDHIKVTLHTIIKDIGSKKP